MRARASISTAGRSFTAKTIHWPRLWLANLLAVALVARGGATDCGEWTLVGQGGAAPRYGHGAVYDAEHQETLVFGGQSNPAQSGPSLGDTWALKGMTWTLKATSGPPRCWLMAMAYDPLRKVIVLHGGENMGDGLGVLDQTWEWDGASWRQIDIPGPGARDRHAMVFDHARGVILLFGGHRGGSHFGDTWQYDGVSWTQVAATGPGPRRSHGLAYDEARGKVVLFGGYDYCCGTLGDTWEWDGVSWTQVASTGPLRRSAQLVYDGALEQVLLFGGFFQAQPETCCGFALDDTWAWDGTQWSQCDALGPSARDLHASVYDSALDRVVVVSGGAFLDDTWELVRNRAPDCSGARLSLTTCWPPSHTFKQVQVLDVEDPDGDPVTITILGISQDEPVLSAGRGSGATCPDAGLVDADNDGNPETAGVRCERDGRGDGRVYTIRFVARDGKGGECTSALTFCVPHDRGGAICTDSGQLHDGTLCGEGGGGALGELAVYSPAELTALTPRALYLRGDLDWDEELILPDSVALLTQLFQSVEALDCPAAADLNNDGVIDIADPIKELSFLFLGGSPPPEPFEALGSEPTDDGLGCE